MRPSRLGFPRVCCHPLSRPKADWNHPYLCCCSSARAWVHNSPPIIPQPDMLAPLGVAERASFAEA